MEAGFTKFTVFVAYTLFLSLVCFFEIIPFPCVMDYPVLGTVYDILYDLHLYGICLVTIHVKI